MLVEASTRGVRDIVLLLRSSPFLRGLGPDDVVLFAEHALLRRHAKGQWIELVDDNGRLFHLLTAGRARVEGPGYVETVEAPGALGGAALLAGEAAPTAMALSACITLEVTGDFLLQVLEDHFSFCRGALRGISDNLQSMRGGLPSLADPTALQAPREDSLVARLEHLGRTVLDQNNLEAVIELARGAERVVYAKGQRLLQAGEPARWWISIVQGEVLCTNAQGSRRVCGAALLGFLDAMAERTYSHDALAVTEVTGYRIHIEQLHSVLRTHPDVGMGLLRWVAHEMIQVLVKRSAGG